MKNTYKIVVFILILLVSISIPVMSQASYSASNVSAKSGENIQITVTSTSLLDSYDISLGTHTGLTYNSCSKSNDGGGLASVNSGAGRISYMSTGEGTRTLGTYSFTAPNVSSATTYTVNFNVNGSTVTSTVTVNPNSTSSAGSSSSGGGTTSSGNSAGNKISSLQVGDKTYSNPNKDITIGSVDASTESIVVKPTTTGGASYTINGGNSTNVALKTGTNVITIAVSGGDTYKVRITRLAEVEEVKPNIIDETEEQQKEEKEETKLLLTSLEVKNFELTPEFNEEVYSYTININMQEKDVDKLDIDAIANAADATIEVIGNENLVEGENIITILVKSVDGEESVVYQIIVNKIDSSSEIVSESVFDRIGFLSDMEPFQRNLLIGFSAFVLLLVIVVIIIIVKKARKNKEPQIPFEGINSKDDVDEAQDIADEEQEEVEIIEESEEPKAEEEQTKQEDSNETFETMNTTLLDEEKAALMDEFFSYNQSVEDNTKAEKKKDKKKGRGKGKHF